MTNQKFMTFFTKVKIEYITFSLKTSKHRMSSRTLQTLYNVLITVHI